jgi:hypothetical protein
MSLVKLSIMTILCVKAMAFIFLDNCILFIFLHVLAKVGDMEHKLSSVEKFTWKVENFSCLKKEIYSEPFVLGGYPWYGI